MRPSRFSLPLAILCLLGALALLMAPGSSVNFAFAKSSSAAPDITANWLTTGNKIDAGEFLGTKNNQPLAFKTFKLERMRIDTAGNVGIGTTTPGTKLDVRGSVSTFNGVALMLTNLNGGNTNHWVLGTGGAVVAKDAFSIGDNSSYKMTIFPNGTVGIGTLAPCSSARLHAAAGVSGFACTLSAVIGESAANRGVTGISNSAEGVFGASFSNSGVYGFSSSGVGTTGFGDTGIGVRGFSFSNTGVYAESKSGAYIFEGKDGNSPDLRRFVVERATGNVKADGSFSAPADFAEMMPVSGLKQDYSLGDVLVIGPDGNLMLSNKPNATNLAGVFSGKPGFLGDTEIAAHGIEYVDNPQTQERIAVALVGIVPVKVTGENGPIRPGDLLTTASLAGHAMKAKPAILDGVEIYRTGAILGKALDAWDKGSGMIRVLVTLR